MNPIERAIEIAGGTKSVASALGMSEWGVRKWVHDGIPPKHVLWLAEASGWQITPNELAPELYPYATDGLPKVVRKARVA